MYPGPYGRDMDVQGIIPPMITPTDDGTVDVDRLATFTRTLVDAGVDGLLPVGSVGEFPSLSPDQRAQVIETVVDHAGDRPVIAGCGDTSVRGVSRQLDRAAAAGADAGLVVTPYYFSASQKGVARFYRAVAEASSLPIFLYDIPSFTGISLSTETVASLATEPGIVGLKDSTSDLTGVAAACAAVPASFTVLQGNPALGFPSLDAGADGIVAGPANLWPATTVAWDRAYRNDDHERATRLGQDVIMRTLRAKRGMATPAAFKHLLERVGFPVGEPLPPLTPLSSSERETLDAALDELHDATVEEPW